MVICLSAIALSYCVTCYWKLLPVVFVVSLHHKALLSYGESAIFQNLEIICFYYSVSEENFWIFFSFLVPKM